MISKEKKTAIIKEYARTEGDTGSPEVQVAVLTARIQELTEHLKSGRDCDDGMPEGVIFECFPVLYSGRIHFSAVFGCGIMRKRGKRDWRRGY